MDNFIFDVDQTLVDSYSIEKETLRKALRIVMHKEYTEADMNQLTVLPTETFFQSIGINPHSHRMQEINREWGRLLEKEPIPFFPEMKETLQFLKKQKCFLAIATSRTKTELDELLCLKELLPFFSSIVTSDMIEHAKPHPESLLKIVQENALVCDKTIYIGDALGDQIAAKAAGISFGYAAWGKENMLESADYTWEKPSEIQSTFFKRK